MKKLLKYFNVNNNFNIKKDYLKFYKYNYSKIEMLEKLISTFLHLFKCNNFLLSDFSLFLKESKGRIFNFNKRKEKFFRVSEGVRSYMRCGIKDFGASG